MDCCLGKIWSDYAQLLANRKAREDSMDKHTHKPLEKDSSARSSSFLSSTNSCGTGSFYNIARTRGGLMVDSRFPLPIASEKKLIEWAKTSRTGGSAFSLPPRMATNGNEHSSWLSRPLVADRQERNDGFQKDHSCISPYQNSRSMQSHNLHQNLKARNPRGSSKPWFSNSSYETITQEIQSAVSYRDKFPHSTTQPSVLSYDDRRRPSVQQYHGFSTSVSSYNSHTQLKSNLATKQKHSPGSAVFAVPLKSSSVGSVLRSGYKLPSNDSEASVAVIESLALTEIKEKENMLKKLEDMQSYRRKFILGALPESPELVLERSIQNIMDADSKDLETISTELMETDLESDNDDSTTETDIEEAEYFQLVTNRR